MEELRKKALSSIAKAEFLEAILIAKKLGIEVSEEASVINEYNKHRAFFIEAGIVQSSERYTYFHSKLFGEDGNSGVIMSLINKINNE